MYSTGSIDSSAARWRCGACSCSRAEAHVAVDLGDDGVVLRTARLEQFGHPRQTAGDVLGLGAFARDPRDHVAGLTSCPSSTDRIASTDIG
jgi:hypothetical protein